MTGQSASMSKAFAPTLLSDAAATAAGGALPVTDTEGKDTARKMGCPPSLFVARPLSMPAAATRGFTWASSVAQMDAADVGIKAGMFLRAWIETQPALPKLRTPSVALFYVLGRGVRDVEGLDIFGRPVAARAESLL